MGIRSMTGFGRARGVLSGRFSASVVVRSVNHKHLDVQVRTSLREESPELEAAVREVVAEPLERGRVTVQVQLERTAPGGARVIVNGDAVAGVLEQLRHLGEADEAARAVELRDVLALPGMVTVNSEETLLDEAETAALREVTGDAVAAALEMKRDEGEQLRGHLVAELAALGGFLDWFEPQMESFRERIVDRLRERIEQLLGPEIAADPDRIVQEAALQADRSDVAEEVVRLRSHLENFSSRFESGGAVGRPLDFLCQEIHRELNTLGSKCREPGVTERLVEAKAATERLREQVQNIE